MPIISPLAHFNRRFAAGVVICLAVSLTLLSARVEAQVPADAEAVASFLSDHVLRTALDDRTLESLVKEMDANVREDPEGAAAHLGDWQEMTPEERAEAVRALYSRLDRSVIEMLPGIGLLTISDGDYDFTELDAADWVIEQIDDALFLDLPDRSSPGRIAYFDGGRIEVIFNVDGEEVPWSLAAVPGVTAGERGVDEAALTGAWTLLQVDENPMESYPSITYTFDVDRSFQIRVGDEVGSGAAGETAHHSGQPPNGRWALSISEVNLYDFESDEDVEGRLLVLASPQEGHQLFLIELLTDDRLLIRTDGGTFAKLLLQR